MIPGHKAWQENGDNLVIPWIDELALQFTASSSSGCKVLLSPLQNRAQLLHQQL